MTDALTFRGVSRSFSGSAALDGIDLTVREDSICGLLGRNGAGKTTLMSIAAGHDRASSGEVEVFGQQPFENEGVLSRVLLVRDNQRYPDEYRLRHVLRIARDIAPNWSDELAGTLADALRIPEKTRLNKLSRGQISSVAIVLGLASRAPLTLLDEPYLGLDVTARGIFHDLLLRDYTAHPRTIVLSTHLIEESEALFDRVVIMDRGRILVDADADDVPGMAFTVTGPQDAVDQLVAGRTVLHSYTVAGLRSATVSGEFDPGLTDSARSIGARLAPTTLTDLVAAYGADAPEPALAAKGAPS